MYRSLRVGVIVRCSWRDGERPVHAGVCEQAHLMCVDSKLLVKI